MAEAQEEALLPLRLEAFKCWCAAEEDMRAAVRRFLQPDPERMKLNPWRFIETAVRRMETTYSLHKPAAKGQPIKVPPEVAQEALQLLWAGFEAEGKQCYWDNIDDACKECEGLAAICSTYGCCPKTLLRAMQREEAACRRRVERMERPLTAANQRARLDACKFLLKCPIDFLRRVFWLDAATIYIVPKDRSVFAPPDADLVVCDPRLSSHSLTKRRMKFYILINAVAGPVALEFVTGTTDLEAEVEWLVSARGGGAACC